MLGAIAGQLSFFFVFQLVGKGRLPDIVNGMSQASKNFLMRFCVVPVDNLCVNAGYLCLVSAVSTQGCELRQRSKLYRIRALFCDPQVGAPASLLADASRGSSPQQVSP